MTYEELWEKSYSEKDLRKAIDYRLQAIDVKGENVADYYFIGDRSIKS